MSTDNTSITPATASAERIREWRNLALAIIAVAGAVLLTALRIMPVEHAKDVIETIVLVVILRVPTRNGNGA